MMKKIVLLICFSFSLVAFSQNVKMIDYEKSPSPTINRQKPKLEINKIYERTDEAAEFPGGINAFRVKLADALVLDSVKTLHGENFVKTTLDFVVERDGTFTDLKASGSNVIFNTEAARAMKSIKGKWKPAKYEGVVVRSRYRIPLNLNFE